MKARNFADAFAIMCNPLFILELGSNGYENERDIMMG